MSPQPEKAVEQIRIRCTPTEKASYFAASKGNTSGWIRQMANERVGIVATTKVLTQRPFKR